MSKTIATLHKILTVASNPAHDNPAATTGQRAGKTTTINTRIIWLDCVLCIVQQIAPTPTTSLGVFIQHSEIYSSNRGTII